jgi:hypothetical protein
MDEGKAPVSGDAPRSSVEAPAPPPANSAPIEILPSVPAPYIVPVTEKPPGTSGSQSTMNEKEAITEPAAKDVKLSPEDDIELQHLTPEEKAIILAQTESRRKVEKATIIDLFRYATPFELFLNATGLLCAIVAGVAQVRFFCEQGFV